MSSIDLLIHVCSPGSVNLNVSTSAINIDTGIDFGILKLLMFFFSPVFDVIKKGVERLEANAADYLHVFWLEARNVADAFWLSVISHPHISIGIAVGVVIFLGIVSGFLLWAWSIFLCILSYLLLPLKPLVHIVGFGPAGIVKGTSVLAGDCCNGVLIEL